VIDGPIEGGAVYGALRTYTLKLYQEIGFPALLKGGQDKKLVGYFQSDTGTINQLLQLWKFDDDADRRAIGQVCPRTRVSSRASPQSFAPCL
jgi:hypothetical protein